MGNALANEAYRALIVGHKGMLGSDLEGVLSRRWGNALLGDLPEFDATDERAVLAFVRTEKPSVIINCAAYTNVDGCEDNVEAAYSCNEKIPRNLARACKEHGALLVHVSTDFVFDGDTDEPYGEDAATKALSVYGKSKLAGERAVIDSGCEFLICRTAWLYGAGGNNFVKTMLRLAKERPALEVVADQFGSPTWTRDLAGMMLRLVEMRARGIVHTVNAGRASWLELAAEAVRLAGLDAKVKPIGAAQYPRKATLPLRSTVLSTERFAQVTGAQPRHWREALEEFVTSLSADAPGANAGA